MECNKCGIEIERCHYGNPNCDTDNHKLCDDCDERVGLGCPDPCRRLEIKLNQIGG